MVDLVDINSNDPGGTKYSIKFFLGNKKVVMKYLIKSSNVPDIALIITYSEYYINESRNLAQEKSRTSCFTEVLSPL